MLTALYLVIAEACLDVPAEMLVDACDLALAESALNAPAATFGAIDLYLTLADRPAALTFRVCNNRALLDGNKRLAYQCLREFLARNGEIWTDPPGDDPDADETVKVMWDLTAGQLSENDLRDWIAARIAKLA
jgi:death-on-curing protein